MDTISFDRIARLLGGATTRRAGLRAALGALAGLPLVSAGADADAAAAAKHGGKQGKERRTPVVEGPCGDGSRKDNACTKDKQCCTGYCMKGLKNKDGKGRCRCIRKGQPCKPSQTCCTGSCNNGVCGKAGIATGKACTDGGKPCADPNASCTTYFNEATAATYCLLPNGKSCAAASDCRSETCAGTCTANTCTVCASGCPYSTVQAAVTGEASGATIRIDAGTYSEDIIVPAKDLILTNCNGSAVTLVNVADDARTLVLGDAADTAPHPTITIRNLTITGKGTPVAGDATPIAPAVGDGGIDAYTNLILDGTSKVYNCNWLDKGGGAAVLPQNAALKVILRGKTEISNNYSSGTGGGIYLDSYDVEEFLVEDSVLVTGNYAGGGGGGIFVDEQVLLSMSGNVTISHNRSEQYGGGVNLQVYDKDSAVPNLIMSGNSSIVFNSATYGGGVYLYYGYKAAGVPAWAMHDNALIADNSATTNDGGGVYADDSDLPGIMDGNALITRNTAPNGSGGGIYGDGSEITIQGGASVIANTPDDCDSYTLATGSKACGVV